MDIVRKDSNGNTRNLKHSNIKHNGGNNTFNRLIDIFDIAKERVTKITQNKTQLKKTEHKVKETK